MTLRQREHRKLDEMCVPQRLVEQVERGGIDHVFRIVQHDHPCSHARALLVFRQSGIEPVQAIGLGRRSILAMHHQPDARIAAHCSNHRGHGRDIVAITADIDREFVLRPGIEHVHQRGSDDIGFLPRGNEHRSPSRQTIDSGGFGFIEPRSADASGQPAPEIGAVERKFVDYAEREKGCREQQQLVLYDQKPFSDRECPRYQAYPLPFWITACFKTCNAGRFAKESVPKMTERPSAFRLVFAPVRALFVSDASAGILLILVAAAAMLAANSPLAGEYEQLFYGELPWTPIPKLDDLHLWINDGLMAVFFFVVGLEVKREWIEGQLSTAQSRRLPILAAAAGMPIPALVYVGVVGGDAELLRGWAIPAATDIAFAMGVLGLLGNRCPASLRLFLLTVAIVDDIGAVMVIALFYTANIKLGWLAASAGVVVAMMVLNRMRVARYWPYILLALALWYFVLNSGIHATIAGVVAALCIPMVGPDDQTMVERMEHGLAPWSAYLVVPVFGFANAGVPLAGMGLEHLLAPLPLAIAAGLVIGKQVGIFAAIVAA